MNMIEMIKWLGTACVILAAGCRAIELHTADLIFSILGAGMWGYVSIIMRDKPLFVVNAFICTILLLGLFL